MILRAIFFIALVALLMPRETGRAGAALHSALGCKDESEVCGLAQEKAQSFSFLAVRSLAQVKTEIEQDERVSRRRSAEID